MKNILVTGAYGFIGRNLCVELQKKTDVKLLKFGSQNSEEELAELIKVADIIIHLAGSNRPETVEEFYEVNRNLTEQVISFSIRTNRVIPIFFASSIQALQSGDYGESKKAAEDLLVEYNHLTGNPVSIYRLPNIFGKWAKPNYNSVVATWCHKLAAGEEVDVHDPNTIIKLAYIDDIVQLLIKGIYSIPTQEIYKEVNRVNKISLKELKKFLVEFHFNRFTLLMPSLKEEFHRQLYSTYLSYLPKNQFSYDLDMKHDDRGWLAEFLKSDSLGQIFISKTKSGVTRGNHWHHSKVEKFLVLQGEGTIKFRHIENEDIFEYPVTGEHLQVVDIPPGYTHSLVNSGNSELITLFWANEIYNKDRHDTTYLEV